MKKKIFLGILIAVAVTCLFAISVSATEIDGVHYTLSTGSQTATVSTDNKTATTEIVTIPSTVEYDGVTYKVTSIANDAFYGNTTMKELRILSEHITAIPSSMIASTYEGALEKIYIDFSKITSIGSAGLNPSNQTNGNSPKTNNFYYYDAKAFLADGSDVLVECPDFSNCKSIGAAAFQGANFKKLVIPAGCSLSNQIFRKSTIEELEILGDGEISISYYVFDECKSLKKIRIEPYITSVSNNVFSGCTSLEEIHVDLSRLVSTDDVAFSFATAYDAGNTTTQWYNLEGDKVVDLSSMENFNGGYGSFASSNIGSAEKIIWPTGIKSITSQTFRRCNITVPMYFNAAEGYTISIGEYSLDGNTPPIVVLGEGVTSYNGGIQNTIVISLADSIAFGDTAIDRYGKGNSSDSTFYYKATETDVSNAKFASVIISGGSVQTFKGCGFVAKATPVDGDELTFNYVEHKYKSVPDNTVCPAGSIVDYICIGCGDTYTETDEDLYISDIHEFDISDGAVIVNIVYENGNYFANGIITKKCAYCDAETTPDATVESYVPLFVALGYSMSEENASVKFVSHSIQANAKAIEEYEKVTGKDVEYGVVAAIADDGKPLELVDGVLTAKGSAVVARMEGTKYSKLTVKLNGVPTDTAVNCNAYVVVDGTIKYLCNDEILDEAVAKIFTTVATEPEAPTTDEE